MIRSICLVKSKNVVKRRMEGSDKIRAADCPRIYSEPLLYREEHRTKGGEAEEPIGRGRELSGVVVDRVESTLKICMDQEDRVIQLLSASSRENA